MRRALIVAAALLLGAPATAQDHNHHSGHSVPVPQAQEATPADAGDWAADALHDPKAMAQARAALFWSTRDSRASLVRLDQLEWRMGKAKDGLAWQGRPYQSLSAIVRASAPQACFSRRTSRTWRISNLPAGIGPLPRRVEGRPWPVLSIADDGSGNPQRVAALPRNRWPLCVGISGRLPSESLATLRRNT